MRSLEVLLDPESEARIRGHWEALEAAGIPSLELHTSASNRPHLTLLAGPELTPPPSGALGELPVTVELGAVLLFPHADRFVLDCPVSLIRHDGQGVFASLPQPFEATRYHSLIVPADSLTDELEATAWSADDASEVMGLRHRKYPIHGVQFHPESFLTMAGIDLLKNFLAL